MKYRYTVHTEDKAPNRGVEGPAQDYCGAIFEAFRCVSVYSVYLDILGHS